MDIVILLGAPGSGKGTVAARLVASDPSLMHVSSGDLLRGAVSRGTEAGREAKAFMDAGKLVPDALIARMIADVVASAPAGATMLLDGFPRNLAQADILDATAASAGAKIRAAVMLDVPDEIIFDRIAGRLTCPKCKAGYHAKNLPPKKEGVCDKCGAALAVRKDDNPETVKDRLAVYHSQTEPLAARYEAAGLLRKVPGAGSIDGIADAFRAAMLRP